MLAQIASLKRQTLCVIREHRKELAEPSGSEQPGLKSTGQESEVVKLKVIEACKNLESSHPSPSPLLRVNFTKLERKA